MNGEENHLLCKQIISEMIAITKDETEEESFREAIRKELLEIKNEIETIILEYS
jgi:hypothetical protein